MMVRSFTAAESETLLVLAASKVTSWAAASCSHETTSWMEKVSEGTGFRTALQLLLCHSLTRFVCVWEVSLLNLFILVRCEATFGLNRAHCVACGEEIGCKPRSPARKTKQTKEKKQPPPYFPLETNIGFPALRWFQYICFKFSRQLMSSNLNEAH